MNRVKLKEVTLFAGLLLLSTLLLQVVWPSAANGENRDGFTAEKVNLALRRTAHHLLSEAGDSTSLIPPVKQTGENEWFVQMENSLNYDRLPTLLQESFDVNGIHRNYDVAVLRCSDNELQLGYNFLDFSNTKEAPCAGRDMEDGCFNLKVTFIALEEKESGFPMAGWVVSGLLALVFYGAGRKWRRVSPGSGSLAANNEEWLPFGKSQLDVTNQVLICNDVRHNLTYREAKLLHLFVNSPNQLLERSHILENVWADEGILVGRSVDMFVSRLRKMLRDDASVGLVAVHGVGYRLEVG